MQGIDLIKPDGPFDGLQTAMTCNGNEIHPVKPMIHAKWVFTRNLTLCNAKSMRGSEDIRTVEDLKQSAEAALSRGDHSQAAELLDLALVSLEAAGEKKQLRAQIAIVRADLYWEMGNLERAAALYGEVLLWLESEYGIDSDVVAICLRNLSEISLEKGDDVRAKFYSRRWREIIGGAT